MKKNWAGFSALPIVCACFVVALAIDLYVYKNEYNWPPIRSDGFGYYVYLPAVFIHHDIFFNFLSDSQFAPSMKDYPEDDWAGLDEREDGENGLVDKYPVGTAIMQTPFFLGAWAIAKAIYPRPISGFELPFQIGSCVSAAFYFAAGVYLLFRILAHRTNVLATSLCLLFTVAATNVLLYASYEGSLSHIYSFFLVSALCSVAAASGDLLRRSFAFGLLLGLTAIVRPTDLVAALLVAQLVKGANRNELLKSVALVACGAALTASPQAFIWLETTGRLVHYSYGNEGFNFLHPEVINYLFSVRKGAFFWHPAYLLMIVFLIAHYRKYRREALIFLAMISVNFYLGAAWWAWWFGGSFGARQAVDVSPAMVIAAGSFFFYALTAFALPLRSLLGAFAALLAAINLVQMQGYITHKFPIDLTTWEIYQRFWTKTLRVTG